MAYAFLKHSMGSFLMTTMFRQPFLRIKEIEIPSNVTKRDGKPLCDLYFDCFSDFAEHSLSDSDPRVSYSVMGM